nr:hypothetical protein [Haloferax sp. BAB-2207]
MAVIGVLEPLVEFAVDVDHAFEVLAECRQPLCIRHLGVQIEMRTFRERWTP